MSLFLCVIDPARPSRIRRGNASHNLGIMRHRAINLLRMKNSRPSIKKKRMRAALNDKFRDKVLCGLEI